VACEFNRLHLRKNPDSGCLSTDATRFSHSGGNSATLGESGLERTAGRVYTSENRKGMDYPEGTGKDARMRICLFEDRGVLDLEPLTLTRPVFDLFCGLTTLAAKQSRYFAPCSAGALVRPFLVDLIRQQRSEEPVNDPFWLKSGPVILVNGRWLPPADSRGPAIARSSPGVGLVNGQVAFAVLNPDQVEGLGQVRLNECLTEWKRSLPVCEAGGRMVERPWDLVRFNAEEITNDFRSRHTASNCRPLDVSLIGPAGQLSIDRTARLDPLVVADTRNGPVVIDRDAFIGAFTRLEGPCYIGPGTQVFGAKIRAGTTIGPYCRIGGEIESSIIQGFTNKYHDGFMGHSYVGEWVNVGAGAQFSDLRHDYGEVILSHDGMHIPSGLNKVGSFIGDHAKIGIGSLLNTGTIIGPFASLLPAGRLLPKSVPSFCHVAHGTITDNTDGDSLFATASEVMRRRGVELTDEQLNVYRRVYEQTEVQRQQVLRGERTAMRTSA
jgi:UDP-N-acetylglucosamine diphosphorylase/glucosamine-1-phosphate N-acetyltransferase